MDLFSDIVWLKSLWYKVKGNSTSANLLLFDSFDVDSLPLTDNSTKFEINLCILPFWTRILSFDEKIHAVPLWFDEKNSAMTVPEKYNLAPVYDIFLFKSQLASCCSGSWKGKKAILDAVPFTHCTEVRFSSFFSGGFTTMLVINPPETKMAKRTSVHCGKTWYVLA